MPASRAASARRRGGIAADGDQQIEAGGRGRAAAFAVQAIGVRAELEHLAEDRDLARAAGGGRDRLERLLQRGGARVVGVVDERDAAGQPEQLAAARRRAAWSRRARRSRSIGTPISTATAVAASTFEQVAHPEQRASRPASLPCGVVTSAAMPSRPRCRTPLARTSAPADIPKVTSSAAEPPGAGANPRVVGVGDEQIGRARLLENLRLGVGDRVGATRRSPRARRRRWSRRARPARRCRRACGSPRRDSCRARRPPRQACARSSSSESGRPM